MFVFLASTFFWVFLDPNESFLEVKTGESATELIPPPEGGVHLGLSDHFCTNEKDAQIPCNGFFLVSSVKPFPAVQCAGKPTVSTVWQAKSL